MGETENDTQAIMSTITRKRWALFVKNKAGAWEAVEVFRELPRRSELAARLLGLEWQVAEIEPEVLSSPIAKDHP